MSLDVAILGFLAQKPRSGYELKNRCFEGPVRAFWTADQAQIYRTLERLRRDGLVTVTRKRQASRPDRRIYEITRAGSECLAGALNTPSPLPPLRDAFLVQIYFAGSNSDDSLLQILQSRRSDHQDRLDGLRTTAAELAADRQSSPRDLVLRRTSLEGAIVQQRAAIDWLDECIDAVQEGALPGSDTGIGQRHLFGV